MAIREIISEEINRFLTENIYSENQFFEKKKKTSDKQKKHKRKKSDKMASDSLMSALRSYYENNKDMIDLRASVAEVYDMSTDTTSSNEKTVKLNSKTRAVLAALNREVRDDNGIEYSLRSDIAQKLLDLWTNSRK